ncbi:MAG: hypothetical protein Q9226_003530 [Calogaya cf. arnoldii]
MCSELHNKLIELLGKGGIILRVELREKGITDFWLVEANPEIIAYVLRWKSQPQPLVKDVIEDYKAFEPTGITYGNVSSDGSGARTTTNDSRLPDRHWLKSIFLQQHAPRDLSMISWPKSTRFPKKPYGYRYDRPSQSAYPIGVIDGGIDPGNSEFDGVRHDLRWYYGPSIRANDQAREQDDSTDRYGKRNFHGSCVASKAIGSTVGVSRTTQLTIFKVSSWLSDASWAFAAVRNSRTPIVVYPWATIDAAPAKLGPDLSTIKDIISDILEDGGIIVVSAGNAQHRSALADTFPSTLEREFRRTLQPNRHAFIVVGAVRSSSDFWSEAGSIAKFSQRSLLGPTGEYWAPGEAIRCAGEKGQQTVDGTSYAAPMVAGLIVNWMDIAPRADPLRAILKTQMSSRPIAPNRYPPVIWNELDGSQ